MRFLFALIIGGFALHANAQTNCTIKGAVRCNCSHSMIVSCDNGQEGFISNQEKVTSVTVRVTDDAGVSKSIKLNNPPGGARDYYAASYSDWVKAELVKNGIRFKDIFGQSFTTANAPTLYDDSDGQSPLSGGGSSGAVKDGLDCSAASEPMVIKGLSPSCSGQKVCHMRVRCSEYAGGRVVRNLGEADAVCKSSGNGVCPSATSCANDPDVTMEKGTFARGTQGAGNRATGAGGVK